MKYLAHTKDGKTPARNAQEENECQELREHLTTTAKYAKEKAAVFGAGETGEIIGLLHDIGKYGRDFQEKMRGKTKRSVNHAMAGAFTLKEKYGKLAEMFGIIIASHHTGLPNSGTKSDKDNINYRGKLYEYETSRQNKILPYEDEINLPEKIVFPKIKMSDDKQICAFKTAFYIRMLFSVLVDSDFTDTEEYCTDRKREPVHAEMADLYSILNQKTFLNDGSNLNKIRAAVLKSCIDAAEMPKGIFSLTVPTGGGKTLSSLAFALKHAKKHDIRRIIYVIPYTSIIEQNSDVIKKILGSDVVLEHHSGIAADGEDFKLRWASENWDIPIVLTTNVQFFESLFSNEKTKARKIHNIADSVIIFDEAQMLPVDYLLPCMTAVSELVENYGVTAVLCSATQPILHKYIYSNMKIFEISKSPAELADQLKRVDFRFSGKKSDDEIIDEISKLESVLVIVNSRRHAFELYKTVTEKIGKDNVFYLSTLITPVHRSEKIAKIKECLREKIPVKVISTSIVECGIDIDFPVVYRSIAGIDSIIQAGGRANREGKLQNLDGTPKLGEVIVFEPCGDNGRIHRSLKLTVDIGKEIIKVLGDKAFELEGIEKYFAELYFTREIKGTLDEHEILSEFNVYDQEIEMNFENAANKFKLIEDNTRGIVIKCDDISAELIAKLRTGDKIRDTVRALQRYSISVYEHEFNHFKKNNHIAPINGINVLITDKYYSKKLGLDIFTDENKNAEAKFL